MSEKVWKLSVSGEQTGKKRRILRITQYEFF